jgi:O-antigen ligase
VARWLAYSLISGSFAAAVFFKGGVQPAQWQWCALGFCLGAVLVISAHASPDKLKPRSDFWSHGVLALILAWMIFQLIPLPPSVVEQLSPLRWSTALAARRALGQSPTAWLALSVAPSLTMARLLNVAPAIALFIAAREMAWWWRDRMWIVVAPLAAVAWLESGLGLVQFQFMRAAGGQAGAAAGTYVNRNHFAGLLEMVFPVVAMWAIATWKRGITRVAQPLAPALRASLLLAVAACLLVGVVLSQSRMGFTAILAAVALTALMWLGSERSGDRARKRHWRWIIPLAVPLSILFFLPTRELILRFADLAATEEISKDTRVQIWNDTGKLIDAYRWTGCGLGAYERGLYRFKTAAPVNRVDFAHNDYLQMLSELGIIGAMLVGLLGTWVLWRTLLVVLFMRGQPNWEMAVGLLGAFLAIGLHSLADFNLYIPANALALAWLAGVAVSPGLRRG